MKYIVKKYNHLYFIEIYYIMRKLKIRNFNKIHFVIIIEYIYYNIKLKNIIIIISNYIIEIDTIIIFNFNIIIKVHYIISKLYINKWMNY